MFFLLNSINDYKYLLQNSNMEQIIYLRSENAWLLNGALDLRGRD